MTAPFVIEFTVPGEPMSKARARVVNGHAYTPERTRAAEAAVLLGLLTAHPATRARPDVMFAVHCVFAAGTRRQRDLDNMLKLVLDALNKHVWADDHQVIEVSARKELVSRTEAKTHITIIELAA